MRKNVVFNFWRIVMPQREQRSFEGLLGEIMQIEAIDQRVKSISGYPVRAERILEERGRWYGEMTKLRLEEIPAKASIDSPLEDLGLDDDEGVGETNGFLYIPSLRILITHGEHFGVSASKLAEYVGLMTRAAGPIYVEPVLDEDAWRKYNRFGMVRSFTVKFGSEINTSLLVNASDALSRTVHTMRNYSGLQMEFKVSVGRARNEELNTEGLSLDIAALIACHEENSRAVEKVSVGGSLPHGGADEVDFLKGRIKHKASIDLGIERRIIYSRRKLHLDSAYDTHRAELELIYGQNS